ncbi:Hydroxymethylpyrimidine/phosphomethylpyrimidine kinase THI20 [Nakaseomyces bracarensis]|uniref:Hydroxymethylpyrimidine/phosphomethylpyrimidine kinase THI20 n=1 Tax=Nakaseomyces bracarensis TaxID=273131 RepID=A0ABR4NQ52_9SACH
MTSDTSREAVQINTPPPYLRLASDENLPVVLTVAGSDSSGGAGIEADVKTITAHRCYAMTCASALTIQTPTKVFSVHPTPREVVRDILDVNLQDMRCDVIKTGMLTVDAAEILADKLNSLGDNRPKLVVDPVLVATSGSSLSSGGIVDVMTKKLTPLADLLTPNVPECFKLIGKEMEVKSHEDMLQLALEVAKVTNSKNILVKGGHIPWADENKKYITDVLFMRGESKYFVYKGNYVPTSHTHGTGCTLASSIASNLAHGYSLQQAVYGGVEYVQNAVSIGCTVTKKHVTTNGPINHVYAINIPLDRMISDECFSAHQVLDEYEKSTSKEIKIGNDFFSYLISHPVVKPHWDSYTKHPFVLEVAKGTIDLKKLQFFIEQDYSYLIDYARVHCIAASKSPTLEDIESELLIVGSVRHEMSEHERRLRKDFGVVGQDYFENIQRGPALKAYSRYFNDVARNGNWQELVLALSPCLMGYGHALLNIKDEITCDEDSVCRDWCDTYLSERYHDAMAKGVILLNNIAKTYPPNELQTLVKIFADVCELETNFWTAALEYSQ